MWREPSNLINSGVLVDILQKNVRSDFVPDLSDDVLYLFSTNDSVNERRKIYFENSLKEKYYFISKNIRGSSGRDGNLTVNENDISKLNSKSNLPFETWCIVGERLTMTSNTTIGDTLIPNGSSGIFLGLIGEKLNIDFDFPIPFGKFLVSRKSSYTIFSGKNFLRRTQFPVELGIATTIHDCQGRTVKNVVVDLSSNFLNKRLIYTACTRVTSFRNLFFSNDVNWEIISEMLAKQNKSTEELSIWLKNSNVLQSPDRNILGKKIQDSISFFTPNYSRLPGPGIIVLYGIVSKSNSSEVFLGLTDNLQITLKEHSSGLLCIFLGTYTGVECERIRHILSWKLFLIVWGFNDIQESVDFRESFFLFIDGEFFHGNVLFAFDEVRCESKFNHLSFLVFPVD